MRQKLKQYLGLVEEASKEQRPTTSGDLQVRASVRLTAVIEISCNI